MQKKLLMITLTVLFTLMIMGSAAAANGETTLQINPDPVTGNPGETVTLSATLRRDSYSGGWGAFNNQPVTFYVDGVPVGTDNTNLLGRAEISYPIPADATLGNHVITAVYSGTGGSQPYNPATDTGILRVDPVYHNTNTDLELTHDSTNQGNQINLSARLTYSASGPDPALAGQTIIFSIDGSDIGSAVTDSNGYAHYTYSASTIGDFDVNARFEGALIGYDYYRSSSDTDDLDVRDTSTSLTVNPTTTGVGNSVTLRSRLSSNGVGMNDQTIHFFVDGVEVGSDITDWYQVGPNWYDWQMGWASITFTPTTPGFKDVQAKFNGLLYPVWNDWNYFGSSSSSIQTLTVTAPTSLTVEPASGYKDHPTTLRATLTSGGHGVECQTVKFFINGNYVGSGTTDASGVATFDYTILQGVGSYPGYITACFDGTTIYLASNGANDLTVNAIPTSLVVDDITGNKGKTVDLKATLTDDLSNKGIEGKKIIFKVNGVDAGFAYTDANGVAILPYPIELVGGTYDITAQFEADDKYSCASGTGKLKVQQSSIYVLTTVSKKNPNVGETIKITFKLGNKGPDSADNVVFTYKIPEGLEFVSLETEPGYPAAIYDPATRTVTWTLGTVPVLDPWLNVNVKVLKAGSFVIDPSVTTDTYDTALPASVQFANVNAVEVVKAASNTVPMQKTGVPVAVLVFAVLAVLGGFIVPKRK